VDLQQIGPILRDKGLLMAGIDVIGDFMTEINVTSATGIRELECATDIRIAEKMFDAIKSNLG
jgi:glutathione synthase